MNCPICESRNDADLTYCESCGVQLVARQQSAHQSESRSASLSQLDLDATTCELCGSEPAWPLNLSEINGRLLWYVSRSLSANFCAACAESAYFRMQSRTLTLGWWALPFFIGPIRTIWSSFSNMRAIKSHRALGAAQEVTRREFKHARKSIGVWLSVTVVLSFVGYTTYNEMSRELARADRNAAGQIDTAGTLLISDLRVGDCFNSAVLSKAGNSVPDDVDAVPCSSSHTFEIIAIGTIRPKDVLSYSGDINAYLKEICLRDFDEYVGIPHDESALDLMWLYPDLKSSPYGSTRFQCIASVPEGEVITFSVRDVMI